MQHFTFRFLLKDQKMRLPNIPAYIFRGVLMKFLKEIDEKFVEELHMPNKIRPYAISTKKEPPYLDFHLTCLKDEISGAILQSLLKIEAIPFNIGGWEFILSQIHFKTISLSQLMQNFKRVVKFQVRFLTPTYFNIRNRSFDIRFPESTFLFPNITKVWNGCAPIGCHLDEIEFFEWLSKNVYVSSYELRTRPFRIGKDLSKSGCIGWANYLIRNSDNDYSNWVDILLRFAEYVNVGGNRTAACGIIKYTPLETVR